MYLFTYISDCYCWILKINAPVVSGQQEIRSKRTKENRKQTIGRQATKEKGQK
jgi:hypothetical protein